MITKPTARRFRIRPSEFPTPAARDENEGLFDPPSDGFGDEVFPTARAASAPEGDAPARPAAGDARQDSEIEAIRREGLTGRQLRLARRVAQKHDLAATSDFDAVRLLRRAGIDPFQRGSVLDLVLSGGAEAAPGGALTTTPDSSEGPQLPQTFKPSKAPSHEQQIERERAVEIMKIQRDLSRRRRRRSALLALRLLLFVGLPTFLCGWYFYVIATPLYATRSEFVIQQAQNPAAAASGLGGLFQGSPLATSQDSITVQGYLQSREAMGRLDEDLGFRAHFQNASIDPLQRLAEDATMESAYKVYKKFFKISFDTTEGVIRMDVAAADPKVAADWSKQLITYAEDQVDHLTTRLREDQMRDAKEGYDSAQQALSDSQRNLIQLQEKYKIISSDAEVGLVVGQISQLENQITQERLSIAQMESNAEPNQARLDPVKRRIATLEDQIATLRGKLTQDGPDSTSLAEVQGELLVAQADLQTRQMMLAQALQSMEVARVEANRQVRYLSMSVSPIPPDEPTFPRAFENTLVTMLILFGIYLMVSMTAAILREQVSS